MSKKERKKQRRVPRPRALEAKLVGGGGERPMDAPPSISTGGVGNRVLIGHWRTTRGADVRVSSAQSRRKSHPDWS
jgi:hypothetical protein